MATIVGALVGLLVVRNRGPFKLVQQESARPDEEIIEVLTREVLRERNIQIFPSAYATLLSIVQGIALGVLASTALPLLRHASGWVAFNLAVECAVTVTVVVLVYYNYVWFLLIFRWVPGALDTLIPFALGIGEISLSATVGLGALWMLLLGVMQAIGALGFGHSLWRSLTRMFGERGMYWETKRLLLSLIAFMFAGTIAALFISLEYDRLGPAAAGSLGILFVVYGVFIIAFSERKLAQINPRHRLARRTSDLK